MSCEAMRTLAHEIADNAASGPNWKQRVGAVADHIGVSASRAFSFYYGSARRIDANEMDAARRAAKALKATKEAARDAEHILWLQSQIEGLREGDADFRGPHINALEHLVCHLRKSNRAVEVRPSTQSAKVSESVEG